MDPEVPMALRLSAHLLVGVVRIYSKKVHYLHSDCKLITTWLNKSFVSTQVDLPEDKRQAPVELVTFLPQAINLDDFDLEDDEILDRSYWKWGRYYSYRTSFQNSSKEFRFLSLPNLFKDMLFDVVSVFHDSRSQSTVPVSEHSGESDVEMAYEAGPTNELGDFNVALYTGTYSPCNYTEEISGFQDPRPSNLTEAVNLSPERSSASSPLGSVPEIEKRRDAAHDLSPASHPPFAAQQQQNVRVEHTESLDETLNEKEHNIPIIDEEVLNSRGHSTFELRSGSPGFAGSEEEHANFVHTSPQLDLQPTPLPPPQTRPRKRKHFDKATVLTNRIMKQRLEDPSNTLLRICRVCSKRSTISSPLFNNNDDIGIEHLRDGGFPEYMPSPLTRFSPSRTHDFTTQPGIWERGSCRTEPSTPEDLSGVRNLGISAIPEMVDEVSIPPVRSAASQSSDALTGRTRPLVEYLKERSSSSPTSSYPSGDLSLSKILAGKTRKLAARMFFETLVLKSTAISL
ncbi:unnamed protein product [Arabis nemorensis]|uniref:Rad21/Rec8-like protein N-terminal domain-containing protein n=1 Tax=Arabis nemorensis TaxID=586526 RepID=A0A565BXY9_9BRAS|nr:unnamed protein product [Arabis nemorensis]